MKSKRVMVIDAFGVMTNWYSTVPVWSTTVTGN